MISSTPRAQIHVIESDTSLADQRTRAVARPQERVLAVAMASHTRLGADSWLGRLLPSELVRAVARRVDAK